MILSDARVVYIFLRRGTLRYGHVRAFIEGPSKLTRPRGLLFSLASDSPAIRHSLVDVHAPHVPLFGLVEIYATFMIQR